MGWAEAHSLRKLHEQVARLTEQRDLADARALAEAQARQRAESDALQLRIRVAFQSDLIESLRTHLSHPVRWLFMLAPNHRRAILAAASEENQ